MIITISGRPCSGKSTIAKLIEKNHGFVRVGVGDLFKAEAKRRGLSSEEFNALCMKDPSYDYYIDKQSETLGKKYDGQKYIFDSRLAWHFVPNSFKVFVTLDDKTMIDRLLNSDREGKEKYSSSKDAKKSLKNRQALETKRYKKLYNVDLYDMKNFDFVVDSSNKTPEELVEIIIQEYEKFKSPKN